MIRSTMTLVAAAMALAGCGGSNDSQVYDEDQSAQAAAALARGQDDVTIRSEDGDVRIRSGDSDEPLPGGLPVYPGAERTGGYSATANGPEGGSGQVVALQTDDSIDRVIAFYRDAIERNGATISANLDSGQVKSLAVTDADGHGGYSVTATNTGSGTAIMITGGRSGG